MKHKRNLIILLVLSFILSVFGFILDYAEWYPDIKQNIIDIALMTGLLYGIGLLLYLLIIFFIKIIPKN